MCCICTSIWTRLERCVQRAQRETAPREECLAGDFLGSLCSRAESLRRKKVSAGRKSPPEESLRRKKVSAGRKSPSKESLPEEHHIVVVFIRPVFNTAFACSRQDDPGCKKRCLSSGASVSGAAK
eukprot:scaffold1006_cov270-Pinguiococcus_pyrenoidosus.AAC.3